MDMTVREMKDRIDKMIADDPSVADLDVDSEGCDCIEPAVTIREWRGDKGDRRVLVARNGV